MTLIWWRLNIVMSAGCKKSCMKIPNADPFHKDMSVFVSESNKIFKMIFVDVTTQVQSIWNAFVMN